MDREHQHTDGSSCDCFDFLRQLVEHKSKFIVYITDKLHETENLLISARNEK